MRGNAEKGNSKPGLMAAVVFNLLNIIMFPVSLLGYVIWIGQGVLAKNSSGVSSTAQGPLSARYTQHNLGVRQDEASARLMEVLPGVPRIAKILTAGPFFLAHRLTGYVPKAFRYPFEGEIPPQFEASARVTFFDEIVDRCLTDIKQFVILGAGFDTRAYRLPEARQVRAFEVDAPNTQALKREMLRKANIDTSGVTFVAADFETQDWLSRLIDAGFDIGQPALFLWEGVIIYLDREAVETTLRKIASTSPGSVLAFDYFTNEPLQSKSLYWRYGRAMTKAAGEPLKFGIDSMPPCSERLAELLQSCGLSLGENRVLGSEANGSRAWGGFATAVVN
ncbi:MAG: SAM-dependent methyltransferase [Syntrophomonadaceae bacterium]|nr:SAM-dependent methyltransferase [Syntrophomonadaceae bacterium]